LPGGINYCLKKVVENATNYIKSLEGFEEIEENRMGQGKYKEFHKSLHFLRDEYLR